MGQGDLPITRLEDLELGLIVLFRIAPAVAREVADGHAGALDAGMVSVAIDWLLVRLERPLTIDGNIGWSARGFPARQTATVTIDGPAYHLAYPVAIDEFGMFSTVFGSTSALGSCTVRVASGPVVAATSFWSGGATHDPNAHVRPWGTIAR